MGRQTLNLPLFTAVFVLFLFGFTVSTASSPALLPLCIVERTMIVKLLHMYTLNSELGSVYITYFISAPAMRETTLVQSAARKLEGVRNASPPVGGSKSTLRKVDWAFV